MVSKLLDRSKAWTLALRFALYQCFDVEAPLDALGHVDVLVDLVVVCIHDMGALAAF